MANFVLLGTLMAAGTASLAGGRNCFLPNTLGSPDWASWFPNARAAGRRIRATTASPCSASPGPVSTTTLSPYRSASRSPTSAKRSAGQRLEGQLAPGWSTATDTTSVEGGSWQIEVT